MTFAMNTDEFFSVVTIITIIMSPYGQMPFLAFYGFLYTFPYASWLFMESIDIAYNLSKNLKAIRY